MKKAVTFTICIGTSACPNKCPICISEMTGKHDFDTMNVDWKAFERSVQVAVNYQAENVLLTGKGEPLLFPVQITKYLRILKKYRRNFTRFELQTSGDGLDACEKYLKTWKRLGLDVIAISLYHYNDFENDMIFQSCFDASGKITIPRSRQSIESKISTVHINGDRKSVV